MPNIKSAKKRVKVIDAKTKKNQMVKSSLKTTLKKFDAVVETGVKDDAVASYNVTAKEVDQACSKGIMHKNKAARTKSQLATKINKMA